MLLQAAQISPDGLANIGLSLCSGASLRDAAWERRTGRDKYTVLVLLEYNAIFHEGNASMLKGPRCGMPLLHCDFYALRAWSGTWMSSSFTGATFGSDPRYIATSSQACRRGHFRQSL